jgi:formylglycine-generating enzyme
MYYASGVIYRTGRRDNVLLAFIFGQSGYMLPTARQWEFAARGGATGRRFPWASTDSIYHERANYRSTDAAGYDTSPTRGYHPVYQTGATPYTSPAGSFAANGHGLFDMAGNVSEWCFHWHPDHPGVSREMRGGSWWHVAASSRVGHRGPVLPDTASNVLGFRVVIQLDL